MDENYLDSLLNEIKLDNEIDEDIEKQIDNQISSETAPKNEPVTVDNLVDVDSKATIDNRDIENAVTSFDELDKLDNLADLDMEGLDFDDIDFDDVDITKITNDKDGDENDPLFDSLDDINIDEFFGETSNNTEEQEKLFADDMKDNASNTIVDKTVYENTPDENNQDMSSFDGNSIDENLFSDNTTDENLYGDNTTEENLYSNTIPSDDNFPMENAVDDNVYNSNPFEDNSFNGISADTDKSYESNSSDGNEYDNLSLGSDGDGESNTSKENQADVNNELDELFSMLGISDDDLEAKAKEQEAGTVSNSVNKKSEETSDDNMLFMEDITDLNDIPERNSKNKKGKKSISQIVFGDPDEDEDEGPTAEELEKKKALKEEKKAKKKEEAEEKKQKQAEKNQLKEAKNKAKTEKKQLEIKKRQQEEALNAEPEKKLNKYVVAIIFVVLFALAGLLVMGTKTFSYELVINKATDYFQRQKYHMAYDQIAGVEVKEKDKPLSEKIYTVMYVQRLYESYENNMRLDRPSKALDSLLRGLDKYDEHYNEAVELGIVSDIDYAKSNILTALSATYGLTEEDAKAMNQLTGYEYTQALAARSANVDTSKFVSSSLNNEDDKSSESNTSTDTSTEASTEALPEDAITTDPSDITTDEGTGIE